MLLLRICSALDYKLTSLTVINFLITFLVLVIQVVSLYESHALSQHREHLLVQLSSLNFVLDLRLVEEALA
jgi:hypothetical protein